MAPKSLFKVSLVATVLTLPFKAQAAEITWTGASNTTFNTAGNWSPGVVPGGSDVAIFGASVTANQPNLTTNQGLGGLKFFSSSGGWTMSGASTLSVDGTTAGFIDDSFNTGGTDTINGSLNLLGNNGSTVFNGGGGGGGNLSILGTLSVNSGGSLKIASGTVTVAAAATGFGKDGPGTLVISGATTSGGITLSGGKLIIGNSASLGTGTFVFSRAGELQASTDVIITNTVTGPQGLGLFATVSGSNNITFTGNWNGAGSDMFLANSLASGKTLSLSNVAIASGTTGKAFAILGTGDTVINGVISNGSTGASGASGMNFGSTGTTTLKGASTYTGSTTISAGKVTLNGATGSLVSTSAMTFAGSGIFNYDNVGASGAMSQTLGALTFSSGDATIQTTRTEAQTVSLSFSNLPARSSGGATRNFDYAGTAGTIGTDSKISFTTGPTASQLIDAGTFFGGGNYAAYDSGGYVRAMNYTTDNAGAGTTLSGSYTTFASANATNKHVDLGTAGIITAAGTETINTLRIGGTNTVTLGSGSTLTITNGGILKTGGNASTISGGTQLQSAAGTDLVIRTDTAADNLTISTMITNGSGVGNSKLTKTGAGTLTLNGGVGVYGGVSIQNGTLNLASSVGNSGGVDVNGGGMLSIGANNVSVAGTVNLNNGNITGTTGVLTATSGYTLSSGTVSAILAGGGVSLNNRGLTAVLTRSNTYTGATTILNGALNIQNSDALGSSAAGTTVNSSGQLQLQGGINVVSEALTLNGTGVNSDGALVNISGNNTWGGSVAVGAVTRIQSDAGTLTLSGGINASNQAITFAGYGNAVVSGAITNSTSTLTKDGYGKLTLTASNNYTGATTVSGGILNIQNAAALGTSAAGTTVSTGNSGAATLQLQGGITVTNETLSLNGVGFGYGGALQNVSGDNTWTGKITNSTAARINSDAGTLTLSGGIDATNKAITFGGAGNIVVSGAITNSTGALTKDGTGKLTLSGANTYSGTTTVNNGTLLLANQNALQNSTLATTTNSGVVIAFDSSVTGKAFTIGGLTGSGALALLNNAAVPEAISLTVSNNASSLTYSGVMTNTGSLIKTGTGTLLLGGSTAAASTGSYQVSAGVLSLQSATAINSRNRVQVDSGAAFAITGVGAGVAGLEGAGTLDLAQANSRTVRFSGTGTYTFNGLLTNSGTGSLTVESDLKEGGTQVLAGASGGYRGGTLMRSGTLALDYSTNASAKLNSAGILTLNGGAIDMRGGSATEAVLSTTLGLGQNNFTRTSGSSRLSLGAVTVSGGVLNISVEGIVTTTSTNDASGLLAGSARITMGGTDFTKVDGSSNIVTFSNYTTLTAGATGSTNTVFSLAGGLTTTTNVTARGLKITTTGASQSLDLGAKTLTLGVANYSAAGALLFAGTNDYTVTASSISSGQNEIAFLNYGTGKLTLNAGLAHPSVFGGTGTIALAKDFTGSGTSGVSVLGGILEFSSNSQIGTLAGTAGVTVWGGTLRANTTSGGISLTASSGASNRIVTLGSDNAGIDVTGGNTLTINGEIKSYDANSDTPLTLGSATSSGKIVLGGTNTYTGTTRLEGGTVSVSQNTNLGNANNWIDFSGNGTLETTATFGSARVVNIRSGKTGTFAPAVGTVLTLSNGVQGAGALTVDGSGTLELLNAANSYTGKTSIKGGTLKLGAGASIATSSEVNLGTTNSPGTLDLTANSSYAFGSGQTVSGVGTISIGSGKTVTAAGIVAPGNSTGIITVAGNFSLTSTSEIKMELAGTGGVAGTDFDKLDVSGYTFTAGGILTITGASGYDVTQTASYDLFDFSNFSNNFTTVTVGGFGLTYDNVNAWKGTNGSTVYSFGINDGVLNVVPEPSTWALVVLGLATLAVAGRRRIAHRKS